MSASRNLLQNALQRPYDQVLFAKEVLGPIFGTGLSLRTSAIPPSAEPNNSERAVIDRVSIYGSINLDDRTDVTLYEIVLQPKVRVEQSKVAIQRFVRKLLTAGQAALVNFISPQNTGVWRLTLVAKDSELTAEGIKEKATHAKRYTYLLGPKEACKTAAERFESLSIERNITFQSLINAFSVEKLSKAFFDEYTHHYQRFVEYLDKSNFKRSTFNGDEKAIRDFSKKLLGRIVFLYFVQKKGWLGASNLEYKDGKPDFVKSLFVSSGGGSAFYSNWLAPLFFETLNQERPNDEFTMPDGTKVKIPFLNGGLFDRDEHDSTWLTFEPGLFHSLDFQDVIPTKKNTTNCRGFLDFLDAFNFTVHEDSPDEHTVAVDPEMLGHIFENLLEDNKDKGAFYTPKEIVHFMCQESLTEYLTIHFRNEYANYKRHSDDQAEWFGNDSQDDKLKMGEQILNLADVATVVKYKEVGKLTKTQLKRIDQLLDKVKICDPAIGSGAFPMGLLQEIHSIKELIAYELKESWNPAVAKVNIIQNSIYGVDIEKGATDIAQLRFWLSLIVDEEKPSALPNLEYKIVVGNSLLSKFEGKIIEIDWKVSNASTRKTYTEIIQKLIKNIALEQKTYFRSTTGDKKNKQYQIRNQKLDLILKQLSLNRFKYQENHLEKGGFAPNNSDCKYNEERTSIIMEFDRAISLIDGLKKNKEAKFLHFDWKLDFPEILNPVLNEREEECGFDIVIGNPPYISYYGNTGSDLTLGERKQIVKSYNSVTKENDRINSMNLFTERGLQLLKPNGILSFIVNKTMAVLPSYQKFREYILSSATFRYTITNLAPFQAIVDCFIFGINKVKNESNYCFKYFSGGIDSYSIETVSTFRKNRKLEFHAPKNNTVLNLMDKAPFRLKEILTINRGVNIGGCFDIFLSKQKATEKHEKYLSGTKCIKPFIWEWTDEDGYMIFDEIEEKSLRAKGKTIALGNHDRYLEPRLFIPESSQTIMAAYVEPKVYSAYGLLVGTSAYGRKFLKYACAILNSKLITFYAIEREILRKGNKATPHVGVKGLNDIPIYKDLGLIDSFCNIVDYIIFLNTQSLTASSDQLILAYFGQILDGMVYDLYLPGILKAYNREIIRYLGDIPQLERCTADDEKMKVLKAVFVRLNDREHPIRVNLFYLNSIPEIAQIESKNENN